MLRPRTCLFIVFLLAIGNGCSENESTTSSVKVPSEVTLPETPGAIAAEEPVLSDEAAVLGLNKAILLFLKKKDYAALVTYIHPEYGVRFSPYGYVDTVRHQHFSLERFKRKVNSNDEINWGSYDGNGDNIVLTCRDYFAKFVYDHDFVIADKTSLNKVLGLGNSLNNLELVYPSLPFVESYFAGFDKKYAGMDWSSLKLVFKKMGSQFYLVGVVHDQWTI